MVLLGGVTVMFLAGLPMWIFLGGAGLVAAALPIALTMMHDYQRKRILIFLDPESDPLGAGYHITQSKIAIGSGGIWGKGYLQGSQSHLDYLPEGHTDFVFATMVEEWGLVGGAVLILASPSSFRWGMKVAANSKSRSASCGRRPDRDDLLLRRDQPDDGHGPRPGGRRPLAPGQLRRLGGDDDHAAPWHPDGAGAPATDQSTLSEA